MALLWRAIAPAVGEKGHPGKVGPSVGINLPKAVLRVGGIAVGHRRGNLSSLPQQTLYRIF